MKEKAKESSKKTKDRSPNYPGIDLATALKKARILREREGKRFVLIETVFGHWGYGLKSSGGRIAFSALKKFGLIEEQKHGRLGSGDVVVKGVRLSDLASRILLDDRQDSSERIQAIKEAALNPAIHKKLWDSFYREGKWPSHVEVCRFLVKDEKFTENAAEDLIREFEKTIEFAKLKKPGAMSGHEEDKLPSKKEDAFTSMSSSLTGDPKSPSKTIEIPIPLSGTEWVRIQASYPLSEKSWKQMFNILNAYKASLVSSETHDEKKEN